MKMKRILTAICRGKRQDNSSNAGENPWQKMANEVLRQPQKESFPTYNESFEMVRGNFQKSYNARVESLQKLKEQLAATDENDSRMVNYLTRRIDSKMSAVRRLDSVLKRMRLNDEEDLKNGVKSSVNLVKTWMK